MNELKAVIFQLKKEVSELKSQNSASSANKAMDCSDFNCIVQEVMDRQKRSKNIIIYGVEEKPDMNKDTRITHDTNCTKNILNFLSCNTDSMDIKPVRLGKYLPGRERPRPIKITFCDEQTVHNVIRKAKLLRGSDFNSISMSLDRTPKQIEYYNKLKRELNERLANGESNLKIETINGLPTIKSLN